MKNCKLNDLVKVKNWQSPDYKQVGKVTAIIFNSPVDDVSVYFTDPIKHYAMFPMTDLELFLESYLQYFATGDRVEITDRRRHGFGWFGEVTKTSDDLTVVFVRLDGDAEPKWYLNNQIKKVDS